MYVFGGQSFNGRKKFKRYLQSQGIHLKWKLMFKEYYRGPLWFWN